MGAAKNDVPVIRNPQTWPKPIRNTLDWIVAQLYFAHALLRERLLDSGRSSFRDFAALLDRSIQDRTTSEEHALLRARFARLPARHRPHYSPRERIAILLLMRRNAWTVKEAARRFVVSTSSIRSWMNDFAEGRLNADYRQVPHNKHAEVVAWIAHELKERYPLPECGYGTIAQLMVQNGIACSKSSVKRKLNRSKPKRPTKPAKSKAKNNDGVPFIVLSPRKKNRTWHMDLTEVRVLCFRFFVAAILDGFSRKLLAVKAYAWHPDTQAMIGLLRQTVRHIGAPRFLVTDHGPIFRKRFRRAVERHHTTLVKGRVYSPEFNGKAERWFRALKLWQRIGILFCSAGRVQQRLDAHRDWYNSVRCHQGLEGRTPDEVWDGSTRPPPQPILDRDPLKPAIELRIEGFRGDANLPVVRIEVIRVDNRAA